MTYLQEIRKLVGAARLFVPGVRAVITDKTGDILLQRRTDSGLWGLPGGSVELDETVLEALKREILEETSLNVIDAEPMGVYCGPGQKFVYPNGDQVQCFAIAFIVTKWSGHPQADQMEGSETRFFPISYLPENLVPIHRQTIVDYTQFKGKFLLSS
ncbi:MAG: NUDIX domain-containing protein [Desulfobacterales bacterium]|jgi:ADP-ribose pyrophosphatase YjhB (NUDIX family)|nr:NUDIX domain-containing protein [Desulfobacterales bacterium]